MREVREDRPVDVDRELVREAAAGRREAFDELVRRHQSRIFNLALTLTGNAGDAEDLAQDAFVRAYKAIGSFRGESSFLTWLYRITVNVVRSQMDRRRRSREVAMPQDEDGAALDVASDEAAADRALITRQIVTRALAALPEDMRIAVTLRDLHGLEYREIAEALDVPIGTVESRIFRARARLRPLLTSLLAGPDAARPGSRGSTEGQE
jgi:RNA polymerase sigma-70 factor (ECF subfamily)